VYTLEFQVGNVWKITWIPGNFNFAYPFTKTDSPLTEAVQLTLFNGCLNIDFQESAESKSTKKYYGQKREWYQCHGHCCMAYAILLI